MIYHLRVGIIVTILSIALLGCGNNLYQFKRHYNTANAMLHDTTRLQKELFFKAHMKDGSVVILEQSWIVDTAQNIVSGKGNTYDMHRSHTFKGAITIPIDSISIFETNKPIEYNESARMFAMGALIAVNAGLTAICITNPKACFGSCPTFYLDGDTGSVFKARGEGFSNAILPSLAYRDIDALDNESKANFITTITMKNEALETHCIKDLKLLAIERKTGQRIYHTRNDIYFACSGEYLADKAYASEGDITTLIRNADRVERSSLASDTNMRAREEILIEYDGISSGLDLGLILNYRQTLMTTYLIYSGIGYMGDQVSDIYAKIESDKGTYHDLKSGIYKELGDVEIYYFDGKEWILAGSVYETGPIAINQQLVPLNVKSDGKPIKLKLVLNQGLWRIDAARLTVIESEVLPNILVPTAIKKNGGDAPELFSSVHKGGVPLVSFPGEVFHFSFTMPKDDADYELFLSSEGYYIEWSRSSWFADKNLLKLRKMIKLPQQYLKDEIKNYKEYEKTMEETFWNSNISQTLN